MNRLDKAPASRGRRDSEFFALHEWCLNPVLSIGELRQSLRRTWELLHATLLEWQREECWINLYLLLCALDCTAADYLLYRPWRLDGIKRRVPGLSRLIEGALSIVNGPYEWRVVADKRRVRAWKKGLDRCVDAMCRAMVDRAWGTGGDLSALEVELPAVLTPTLPRQPSEWRMRIPEAFRCQDLTHHDVIAMAQRFAVSDAAQKARGVFVVGPRTAGAYFAPLVSACLERWGFKCQGWISIRPKEGLSRAERGRLASAGASAAQVVIIDDHPNTGNTFTLLVRLLSRLGVLPQNMTILAPYHPAQTEWKPLVAPVQVVTLDPGEFHKARLLRDDVRLLDSVRQLLGKNSNEALQLRTGATLDRINTAVTSHYGDSFQVRLKRAFQLEWRGPARQTTRLTVLAKSVGWGWLGYHAFLAAERLQGFVPGLLGLRDGLLFMEWVGDDDNWPAGAPEAEAICATVPAYVAARVDALRLSRDPTIAVIGYRETGRDRIASALRRPFSAVWGRLAMEVFKRRLAAVAPPTPTLVDGKMTAENWIRCPGGVRKVDFEHHNFGGGEQDIVDPAYDLAGASHALGLDHKAEERMVADYARLSGDTGVRDRLLQYKYLVGLLEMDRAAYELQRALSPQRHRDANLRFLGGRNYLTFQFNRHHASRIQVPAAPGWSSDLFFLDLDGVFDIQALGFFPHTTPSGLVALRRLQMHGFSVIPNTGRSVEHVRDYCRNYGLPGGVAEYGCIFVDWVSGREELLFAPEQAYQLARCRARIEALPGIYVDPDYRSAVRAFRYRRGNWVGLSRDETDDLMHAGGFDTLDVIYTSTDTYFVPRGVNKGTALSAVKERIPTQPSFVAAIGDSVEDVEMLRRADRAFVPANASSEMRAIAGAISHVRTTRHRRQKGLLEAVDQLLRERGFAPDPGPGDRVRTSDQLVDWVVDSIDQSRLRRWMGLVAAIGTAGKRRFPVVATGIPRATSESCE
jgi:hydroxymethylpyrimidine pyrophosphatase-like HAD family hydrolase